MKHLGLVLFLFPLFVNVLNAQYSLGLKTGVNISTLTQGGFGQDFFESRTDFVGGLTVEWRAPNYLALQAELLYSRQGAGIAGTSSDLILDYLQVPILAKFYIWEGLYGAVGAQLGFLIDERLDATVDNFSEFDLVEDAQTFEFSLPVGVGYHTEWGLSLDFSYDIGISNVFDDGSPKTKNELIQLSIGYHFAL
ncbi:MAG: PorT family protein [Saprospiraceae bacterium]|nr:PorT family protein [Saprospiraceae bacterium]